MLILTPLLANKLIENKTESTFRTIHGETFTGRILARFGRKIEIEYCYDGNTYNGLFLRADLRVVS